MIKYYVSSETVITLNSNWHLLRFYQIMFIYNHSIYLNLYIATYVSRNYVRYSSSHCILRLTFSLQLRRKFQNKPNPNEANHCNRCYRDQILFCFYIKLPIQLTDYIWARTFSSNVDTNNLSTWLYAITFNIEYPTTIPPPPTAIKKIGKQGYLDKN